MLKYNLYTIAFISCIVLIIVIIWKLCKAIKEINIIEEELKMSLYDEKNNCFVPNPPEMKYWEIITKISTYKNISLKEAAKDFSELSGEPSNEILEIILNADEKYLIPFEGKIKICNDEDNILSYGIQPKMAGKIGYIKNIVIDDEHFADDKEDKARNRVYYLIDIDDSLYSCEILNKV